MDSLITHNSGMQVYTDKSIYNSNTNNRIRSKLARKLLYDIKRDNSGIMVIEGATGSGKSTLALRLAYNIVGDWDKVIDHYLVFTPFELEEKGKWARKNGVKLPLLIWDDAGPWMRLAKNLSWDPLAISIIGHFETMRTWVGIIIMTMTTEKHLPKAILENGNLYRYKIHVYKDYYDEERQQWRAIGVAYTRKPKKNFDGFYWDTYNIIRIKFWHFRKGDPIYEKYNRIRAAYSDLYDKVMESAKRGSRAAIALNVIHDEWKRIKQEIINEG